MAALRPPGDQRVPANPVHTFGDIYNHEYVQMDAYDVPTIRLQNAGGWGLLGLLGPHLGHLKPQLGQKGAFWAKTGPFGAVFDSFLELGCSIWAVIVLDEQGVALQCSGHPISLYFEQNNIPPKMGPWKFRNQGRRALLGHIGCHRGPICPSGRV